MLEQTALTACAQTSATVARAGLATLDSALRLRPADAQTLLARVQCWSGYTDHFAAPAPGVATALAQAQQAVRIAPGLAAAYSTLGLVQFRYLRAVTDAEASFAQAIRLDSANAGAHAMLSDVLAETGRTPEALEEAQRALTLDPASEPDATRVALLLAGLGRTVESLAHVQRVLDADPASNAGSLGLASILLANGRAGTALRVLQRARQLGNAGLDTDELIVRTLARMGRTGEARAVLDAWLARSGSEYLRPDLIAAMFATLEESDSALAWLNRAQRDDTRGLVELRSGRFATLDPDPDYQQLLARARPDLGSR